LKDVFIVKNVLVGAFYVVLNDVLVHFFTIKFWKFKKNTFFRYVKRLGMTTVGMPGHGFTFPVEGIVPVIFSSMPEASFPLGGILRAERNDISTGKSGVDE
jgi:hypothetical protein